MTEGNVGEASASFTQRSATKRERATATVRKNAARAWASVSARGSTPRDSRTSERTSSLLPTADSVAVSPQATTASAEAAGSAATALASAISTVQSASSQVKVGVRTSETPSSSATARSTSSDRGMASSARGAAVKPSCPRAPAIIMAARRTPTVSWRSSSVEADDAPPAASDGAAESGWSSLLAQEPTRPMRSSAVARATTAEVFFALVSWSSTSEGVSRRLPRHWRSRSQARPAGSPAMSCMRKSISARGGHHDMSPRRTSSPSSHGTRAGHASASSLSWATWRRYPIKTLPAGSSLNGSERRAFTLMPRAASFGARPCQAARASGTETTTSRAPASARPRTRRATSSHSAAGPAGWSSSTAPDERSGSPER